MCIIYNYRHRVIFESITKVRQVVYTHDYIYTCVYIYKWELDYSCCQSPIQPNVALFMPDKQTGLSEGGRYYYIIHFFSILVFFLDHRKITNQKITQNVTIIVGMILNSFLIDSPRQSFRKYTKG